MNYNYSFNNKSNKLSINASHKSSVNNETHADLIKTNIVSALDAINSEVLLLEKIGTTATRKINVSGITALDAVNGNDKIVWLSNPINIFTNQSINGIVSFIIAYDNEIIFKKMSETDETSPSVLVQNSSPQSLKTYAFGYNSTEDKFFLKRIDGDNFTFTGSKLRIYRFDQFHLESSNFFNTIEQVSKVEETPATSGLTLKIGNVTVASYDTVINNPVDSAALGVELDKLIAGAVSGYSLSKELKQNSSYDVTIFFEVTESNYLLLKEPITLQITNNIGYVTYEQYE